MPPEAEAEIDDPRELGREIWEQKNHLFRDEAKNFPDTNAFDEEYRQRFHRIVWQYAVQHPYTQEQSTTDTEIEDLCGPIVRELLGLEPYYFQSDLIYAMVYFALIAGTQVFMNLHEKMASSQEIADFLEELYLVISTLERLTIDDEGEQASDFAIYSLKQDLRQGLIQLSSSSKNNN